MKDAPRILVVDDDPGIGLMLTKALARHGFQVDAATSADEALEKSETTSYDAALVDLVMPGRDGKDLADTLRRRFPGLPIGLLTGYTHSPLIPAFEKSGMAVFQKPVLSPGPRRVPPAGDRQLAFARGSPGLLPDEPLVPPLESLPPGARRARRGPPPPP